MEKLSWTSNCLHIKKAEAGIPVKEFCCRCGMAVCNHRTLSS